MINELALRYGQALFELASENKSTEKTLEELRVLSEALEKNPEIIAFFDSQLISLEDRSQVFNKALGTKLSNITTQFMQKLIENGRLGLFSGMVQAFEQNMDEVHGALRGTVKSATALSQEERKKIEEQISKTTGKKVILQFEENPSLVGGMVAQVGGWTFDDSLKSHLLRMSDELNRRAH